MASALIKIITSADPAVRNESLEPFCARATLDELIKACGELDAFRRESENLYERVRALFFLYAIHRFYLPVKAGMKSKGTLPFKGYTHLLQRRFEEAIEDFLEVQERDGANDAISSALAVAYHWLG